MSDTTPASDAKPYLGPCLEKDVRVQLQPDDSEIPWPSITRKVGIPLPDKLKLLYYVKITMGIQHLCISLSMAPDILIIAYGNGYLGFSRYYEIITYS